MSRLGRWRVCNEPGCGVRVLAGVGKCERHRSEARKRSDAKRPSAAARGYGSSTGWPTIRKAFLAAHPLCVDCPACSEVPDHDPVSRAELVRRGVADPDAWEFLVPRCTSCHNRRTAETVGFGR